MIWSALAVLLSAVDVAPRSEEAFRFVFRQELDSSCGYAVVASLLTLYAETPVSEAALVKKAPSDRNEIDFLMMRDILGEYGYAARGYRMRIEQLEEALAAIRPLIVHYRHPTRHFVLLLGVSREGFVVADPAVGLALTDRRDFASRWSGAVMAASIDDRPAEAVCREATDFVLQRTDALGGAGDVIFAIGQPGVHQ